MHASMVPGRRMVPGFRLPWARAANGCATRAQYRGVSSPPAHIERRRCTLDGVSDPSRSALRSLTRRHFLGVFVVVRHIALVAAGQRVERVLHLLAVGLLA